MTPAPVDHDERRERLTGVLLEVVAESGLESASIRAIAARAGVSIGTVQHYFTSKDEMLQHAYRRVNADLGARAEAAAEHATSWRDAVRAILLVLLPLDADGVKALRINVAFAARAMFAPELATELRKDLVEIQQIMTDLFAQAGVPEPAREAMTALALTSGLAEPLLFGEGTNDEVIGALDAYLDRVFA